MDERNIADCGDNSCMLAEHKGGMRTNGGCRCSEVLDTPEPGEWDDDKQPREPGCQCHLEAGDSPCVVHGEDEDAGGGEEPKS